MLPRTVNEGFLTLLSYITPSGTETAKAASHRESIRAVLAANFTLERYFPAGSFGHGTSVRGWSDVDYFAVIPDAELNRDSSLVLRWIKDLLANRFPNTGVYVDSPAVAVPFGSATWERHEITPACFKKVINGVNVYTIPNRAGGWMYSSPTGLNANTNTENDRLSKRVKQLVRLVKLWNFEQSVGIRSTYLEARVVEYCKSQSSIVYSIDMLYALKHLQSKGLAAMQDPTGTSGYIYPCTDAVKTTALSKLSTAVTRATKARTAEEAGYHKSAFEWWDILFAYSFPAYS